METITFAYNDAELLQQTSDSSHTYSWVYDDLDRLTQFDTAGTAGLGSAVIDYTWDAAGNPVSRSQTIGTDSVTTSYVYDGIDRLTETTQSGTSVSDKVVTIEHHADSTVSRIIRYADLAKTQVVRADRSNV